MSVYARLTSGQINDGRTSGWVSSQLTDTSGRGTHCEPETGVELAGFNLHRESADQRLN